MHIRSIPRYSPARWLVPLAALVLIASACGGISKPAGYAEPQVDGDVLYVSLDPGKMAAVDSGDFSVLWEFPREDDFACGNQDESTHDLRAIYGAPLIDGGRLYFGAYDGNVYAVNAEDGSCEWESHKSEDPSAQCPDREPDGPIVGGMTLVDDILYAGSDDGQLYGFDAETGAVRVCVDLKGAIWTTPLAVDEELYVSTMHGALWAVRTTRQGDPEPTLVFETDAGLLTDPVLAGDKIIVGGIGETLFAINLRSHEQAWEFPGGNWFWGRPLVDEATVYATNLDGKVYAINAATGASAWQTNEFEAPDAIRAAPLLAGDALVVVDRDGNIYSLDPATGEVTKPNPAIIEKRVLANPIEFDGGVLVVTQKGDLYRVEPGGEEPPKRVEVRKP